MGDFYIVQTINVVGETQYQVFPGPDNTAALAAYTASKPLNGNSVYYDLTITQANTQTNQDNSPV